MAEVEHVVRAPEQWHGMTRQRHMCEHVCVTIVMKQILAGAAHRSYTLLPAGKKPPSLHWYARRHVLARRTPRTYALTLDDGTGARAPRSACLSLEYICTAARLRCRHEHSRPRRIRCPFARGHERPHSNRCPTSDLCQVAKDQFPCKHGACQVPSASTCATVQAVR